jgi:hypothetical protein
MDVHMTTKREDLPQSEQGQDKTGPMTRPGPANYDHQGAKILADDRAKGQRDAGDILGDNRPFDFIERSKPEDRLPPETAHGQITRDNVNPNIPSSPKGGERGMGIVDPKSLGMEQGRQGAAVPKVPAPDQQVTSPNFQGSAHSINEPLGSTIGSNMDAQGQPITGGGAGSGVPNPDTTPAITELEPDEATIGEETFDLFVHGTGFTEDSVIVFAGQEEPTDLEDDGTLSTGINMDVWNGADTVQVSVKNGDKMSNMMDFTFHAEPATRKAPPKAIKRKGKGEKAKKKAKR